MSVICRKFLLKLALRTQTFLKRGHTSTLSTWTEEIKAKSEEEPCKQQLTVTLSDYKHLADTKQFFGRYKNLYVTVPFLTCFILYFRALSKYKPPGAYIRRGDLTEGFWVTSLRGLYMEGLIFRILRYYTRRFATRILIFSATHRCNVGTML